MATIHNIARYRGNEIMARIPATAVQQLKQQPGKGLVVGGVRSARSLVGSTEAGGPAEVRLGCGGNVSREVARRGEDA
jgi:hypothetical protein